MRVGYPSTFSLTDMRLQSAIAREANFIMFDFRILTRQNYFAENPLTDIFHFDVELRDIEKVMDVYVVAIQNRKNMGSRVKSKQGQDTLYTVDVRMFNNLITYSCIHK